MGENLVIYGVKGSIRVKKAEVGDLLMTYCCYEMQQKSQEGRVRRLVDDLLL